MEPLRPPDHKPEDMQTIPRKALPDASLPSLTHYNDPPGERGNFAAIPDKDPFDVSQLPSNRKTSNLVETIWIPEALSFLLSLIALAAVVILLATQQGQPLPKWPALISINSLIAILTAILKAALLFPVTEAISELKWVWYSKPRPVSDFDDFDGASRGPWGALRFLFRHPSDLLTSFGAVIAILSLAIDPFAQQIVQYHSCMVPKPGANATVVRANAYENGMDGPMTLALYEGLLNPPTNASSKTPFICPTGNCTFVEKNGIAYSSLAMCSQVYDITHLVSKQKSGNYTLPSGASMSNDENTTPVVYMSLSTVASSAVTHPSAAMFYYEALVKPGPCSMGQTDCNTTPWAFSAYLYPCVRMYGNGVTISEFVLREPITHTAGLVRVVGNEGLPFYSLAGDYPASPDVDCTPSKSHDHKRTIHTLPDLEGRRYLTVEPGGESVPDSSANSSEGLWYDARCTYSVSSNAIATMEQYWPVFFSSDKQVYAVSSDPFEIMQGPAWLLRLYGDKYGSHDIPAVAAYMQGLANSVTVVLRGTHIDYEHMAYKLDHDEIVADIDYEPAHGTVLAAQTCAIVDWRWLALPVVIVALALAFVAAAVMQSQASARPNRSAWKSSVLPLLWCGFSSGPRVAPGTVLTSVDQMRLHGNRVQVALRREENYGQDLETPGKNKAYDQPGKWTLVDETPCSKVDGGSEKSLHTNRLMTDLRKRLMPR